MGITEYTTEDVVSTQWVIIHNESLEQCVAHSKGLTNIGSYYYKLESFITRKMTNFTYMKFCVELLKWKVLNFKLSGLHAMINLNKTEFGSILN